MNILDRLKIAAEEVIMEEGAFLLQKASLSERPSDSGVHSDPESGIKTHTKSSFNDLVTTLDVEIEKRLKDRLDKLLPGSSFLAEETAAVTKETDKLWVIDPIDGTTNFVHRFPFFCISVGLQLEGSIVLGFVYNPLLNEFFSAQKGKGSNLNGKPLKVSRVDKLSESLLATGFAYNFATCSNNNINHFESFQAKSQGIRRLGSAALDICYVAKGVLDGFWELYLKPWDVAAGILIAAEAGGMISNFEGEPYSFKDDSILITNSLLHKQMLTVLSQHR